MAKGSGGTRMKYPSSQKTQEWVRLRDRNGEYGEPVKIYGNTKQISYDWYYHRFTPVIDKRGLSVIDTEDASDYGLPDTVAKSTMLANYEDFKTNKQLGYDVRDDSFTFITKNGNVHFAFGEERLPSIKMSDVIYISHQSAVSSTIWYDNKADRYKEKIYAATHEKVL